jgi:hypothetical protein
MVYLAYGQWIADLRTMTCRNYVWNITVAFEKQGDALIGEISEMPNNPNRKWIFSPIGDKIRKKIIKEAEEVFLKAYSENHTKREIEFLNKKEKKIHQFLKNQKKELQKYSRIRLLKNLSFSII